ncbi:hypothetical protein RDI58_021024 [Solanum bulbocastanum]|uniref:Uncharacterized protein n=1 Tax=Solanum bulbocastanum TaxID=147425 RepID=A0AAN8TDJ2_SOLBU
MPCNNKLIGARVFPNSGIDPWDEDGHGTHTASTAAGRFVQGANIFGNANGTATGVAPLAHVAVYKACSADFCSGSDILAAMDMAIEDGVDILSISLGSLSNAFYGNSVALGAFSALKRGIFVSCSGGNSGPYSFSMSNEAPWILTVGASTINRKIQATVVLGNNQEFDGESALQPNDFPPTLLPLAYPGSNASDSDAKYCTPASLNNTNVMGKIVLCEAGKITRADKGIAVKAAGGAAMIFMNREAMANTTLVEAYVLPTTYVGYADGLKIKEYIDSTPNPTATIVFKGTIIGDDRAPVVASFSSRGPSYASPGILKPDIIGPGVNILAAWHISLDNNTNTNSRFNMISGTSMSCPHLSGVAALLKSVHPDWSPAAIKSAIMTTADVLNLGSNLIEDETYLPANVFATGAGHCNNKLIGARYFRYTGNDPWDENGHGTHTASTAAGRFVPGANIFGNANGTAVGVAPLAHVAIYKTCSAIGCSGSDVLAAIDMAIEDGVDVLSISLGSRARQFYEDIIALGAFSAMERGIFVSCSAGNSGPNTFSISNDAPWILTVGASTIDRKIKATAVLGNNQEFDGESAFQPSDFPPTLLPLIYPGINDSDILAQYCYPTSLNTNVIGKIVLCESGITRAVDKGIAVKAAGGAAMIIMNPKSWANTTFAEAHVLPVTHVTYADGLKIQEYINSTTTPTATIVFKGTTIGDNRAPVVAGFSSRGPSYASPRILKPDIIGPGVNILAAWPVSLENNTNTNSTFNMIAGTPRGTKHHGMR